MAPILLAILAIVSWLPARGETAMLECTSDATSGGAASAHARAIPLHLAMLNFRFSVASGWVLWKATLAIHVAEGQPADQIDIGIVPQSWAEEAPPRLQPVKGFRHKANPEANGWLRLELQPVLLKALSRKDSGGIILLVRSGSPPAVAIHTRESLLFAPYLILEGSPRAQR